MINIIIGNYSRRGRCDCNCGRADFDIGVKRLYCFLHGYQSIATINGIIHYKYIFRCLYGVDAFLINIHLRQAP